MDNLIIVAIIVLIVALAAFYVYKAKKSGRACIGCPDSCNCHKKDCGCCDSKNGNSTNK